MEGQKSHLKVKIWVSESTKFRNRITRSYTLMGGRLA